MIYRNSRVLKNDEIGRAWDVLIQRVPPAVAIPNRGVETVLAQKLTEEEAARIGRNATSSMILALS